MQLAHVQRSQTSVSFEGLVSVNYHEGLPLNTGTALCLVVAESCAGHETRGREAAGHVPGDHCCYPGFAQDPGLCAGRGFYQQITVVVYLPDPTALLQLALMSTRQTRFE